MAAAIGASRAGADGRGDEVNVVLHILGRFAIADKRGKNGERRQFACRMLSLSQSSMLLASPVTGQIGERVISYFEDFGNIQGSITRVMDSGFVARILATSDERSRLMRKLVWLRQNKDYDVPDGRKHKRIIPGDPISTLIFPDAGTMRCFVIDMSASGVAISADTMPEIGSVLAVGTVPGKVVRHFDEGFAVRFHQLQDHHSLEHMVVRRF